FSAAHLPCLSDDRIDPRSLRRLNRREAVEIRRALARMEPYSPSSPSYRQDASADRGPTMRSIFPNAVLKPAGWFALTYLGYWSALVLDQLLVELLFSPLLGASLR